MKKVLTFVVVAAFAPALFVACASSDTGIGGAGGTGAVTTAPSSTSGGQTTNTAAVTASSSTGGGCGACNISADCTNTCAAAPANESNCCDTQTHMCYVNPSATCPAQGTSSSASTGTSMY